MMVLTIIAQYHWYTIIAHTNIVIVTSLIVCLIILSPYSQCGARIGRLAVGAMLAVTQ